MTDEETTETEEETHEEAPEEEIAIAPEPEAEEEEVEEPHDEVEAALIEARIRSPRNQDAAARRLGVTPDGNVVYAHENGVAIFDPASHDPNL